MAPEEIETGAKVKNKALLLAYEVAKKRPSLEEFKDVLWGFEKARVEEERIYEEKLAADEKKQADKAKEQEEPKAKKTKRKSTAIADEDAMDVDEEEPEAPKPSKKRKKSGVEPDEEEKVRSILSRPHDLEILTGRYSLQRRQRSSSTLRKLPTATLRPKPSQSPKRQRRSPHRQNRSCRRVNRRTRLRRVVC